MNALLTNLLSNQTTANILVLGAGFILFFFFVRREFRYEIKANMEIVKANIEAVKSNIDSVKNELNANLKAEIAPIKVALDNHITDTNKKIEDLKTDTNKQFDNLRQDMKEGFKEIKEAMKAQKS